MMEEGKRRDHGSGWWDRLSNHLFPERQVHLRTDGRVTFLRFSRRSQIALVALLAVASGWMAFSSASYLLHDKVLAAKEVEIANARLAYRSILLQVAEYQKRFTGITRDLEENHTLMLSLVEQNTVLQQNLNVVEDDLQSTQKDRAKVIITREELKARLNDIQDRMRDLGNNNFALRDDLDTVEKDLRLVMSERNEALQEGTQMRRHIKGLENTLVELEQSQQDAVQRLTEHTLANIDGVEKLIKITGLKAERLLASAGSRPRGQGGPFIAARQDGELAGSLKANLITLDSYLYQWDALRGVVSKLPLTVPMDYFKRTSRYGKRKDPINGKWAMHYGIDLGGIFKSAVYATAPGVVSYVGWKGKYGRLVELDHGAGIKTRYGHLHKTLVKKGQKIGFRDKIGLLGSTGRSTGAHLHYEIQFGGRPQDPMKFIKAGRYVFQNQ
jgi:murein DD-endopeptidase MepM/ murein hydrolase activator NlpD